MPPRIVEIRKNVLKKNDLLARELRTRFERAGVLVVNLVSSPGAGKTSLLEGTLRALLERAEAAAVLVGDLETDNDARRLGATGAPVRQIETHGICHLDARMVADRLAGWDLGTLDYLFIENVGNLVCPAAYDLGEEVRVALLSVTEGEDKPVKYPVLFHSADLALVTKIDLAAACEFSRRAAYGNLRSVCPATRIIETSAKRADGLADWLDFLVARRAGRKGNVCV